MCLTLRDFHSLGMTFLEQHDTTVHVAAVIVNDDPRSPCTLCGVLQSHVHRLLGRTLHRHHRHGHNIHKGQGASPGIVAEPNSEDHKALAAADLDGMVNEPDPVVRCIKGTSQGGQANPHHPEPDRRPVPLDVQQQEQDRPCAS